MRVYYFSFATYATIAEKENTTHRPDSKMSFHLWATSFLIGHDKNAPSNDWYENDGICNTISMSHPSGSTVKNYDGIPQKGIWQIVERVNLDHQAVIGHNASKGETKNIIALYNKHTKLLYSLE